jgi:hypothetical protein
LADRAILGSDYGEVAASSGLVSAKTGGFGGATRRFGNCIPRNAEPSGIASGRRHPSQVAAISWRSAESHRRFRARGPVRSSGAAHRKTAFAELSADRQSSLARLSAAPSNQALHFDRRRSSAFGDGVAEQFVGYGRRALHGRAVASPIGDVIQRGAQSSGSSGDERSAMEASASHRVSYRNACATSARRRHVLWPPNARSSSLERSRRERCRQYP